MCGKVTVTTSVTGQNGSMRIQRRYFRRAEVDTVLGDPTRAKERLDRIPEITVQSIFEKMVFEDHKEVPNRHARIKADGYELPVSLET